MSPSANNISGITIRLNITQSYEIPRNHTKKPGRLFGKRPGCGDGIGLLYENLAVVEDVEAVSRAVDALPAEIVIDCPGVFVGGVD